jgi:formylglycine-generating enzyme required for sulfatase activity
VNFIRRSESGIVNLFTFAGICAALALSGCASGMNSNPKPAAPEAKTNSIGMTMVPIPAGRFTMGSAKDEQRREMDELPHAVALTSGSVIIIRTSGMTAKGSCRLRMT